MAQKLVVDCRTNAAAYVPLSPTEQAEVDGRQQNAGVAAMNPATLLKLFRGENTGKLILALGE